MPTCLNEKERLEFITDNKLLWTTLRDFIPEANKLTADECMCEFMAKWKKIFNPIEVSPIVNIEKDIDKLNKMYTELKNSVNFAIDDVACVNLVVHTIEECTDTLGFLISREKTHKAELRFSQYQIGSVLKILKNLSKTKKNFSLLLKKFKSYSISYAYKMIDFYDTCEQYYNLRFTTMPLNNVLNYLSQFRSLMAQDREFWSPPQPAVV